MASITTLTIFFTLVLGGITFKKLGELKKGALWLILSYTISVLIAIVCYLFTYLLGVELFIGNVDGAVVATAIANALIYGIIGPPVGKWGIKFISRRTKEAQDKYSKEKK